MTRPYPIRPFIIVNRFGRLHYERIAPYMAVRHIHSKDLHPSAFFDIETAEKIALITDNAGIQIAFAYPGLKHGFFSHHLSSCIAAPCRIVTLDFYSDRHPSDLLMEARFSQPEPVF